MSRIEPVRMVIVGCGMIAEHGYQPRCQAYPHLIDLVGDCDQDSSRSEAHAKKSGGKVYESLEEVLNDDRVEAIINLTIHKGGAACSLT